MSKFVVFQFTDPNETRRYSCLGVMGKTYETMEAAEQAKCSCIDYDLANHNGESLPKYRVESYMPEGGMYA